LVSMLTCVSETMTWRRQAGHGVLRLEAMLCEPGQTVRPSASAMLLLPTEMRDAGRADNVACLWLHVEPRARYGSIAHPVGLSGWYECLLLALSGAPAFAEFLAARLGLQTRTSPAVRVGVMLKALQGSSRLGGGCVQVVTGCDVGVVALCSQWGRVVREAA